ncbi:MAG TPA: SDR family NAD(P)-dependent oxidoreductase [Terriglobales bacterium]|nr:SDR family NAD(P)-dependent oxidoreductase [Terriglobales bacterium]
MRLDGRVAVVTGAAHGLGRGISVELAREGATVWACDVLAPELDETRRAVEAAAAGACRTALVDVGDPGAVTAFIGQVDAASGRIDALVNVAGGVAGQTMRPVEDVTDEEWRVIFAINLDGAFHFTRAVAPVMKRARRGAIVNISSGAGRSYSLTGIQAYASAKAGLIGFTRQTARELGAHGIRVNSVAPGFVRSNPATDRQWDDMGAEGQRRLLDSIALGRLGRPEEIARAVVFFLSDDAAYVTGQTISVDGGHWMLG